MNVRRRQRVLGYINRGATIAGCPLEDINETTTRRECYRAYYEGSIILSIIVRNCTRRLAQRSPRWCAVVAREGGIEVVSEGAQGSMPDPGELA